jgi:hypothetical protein
VFIGTSGSIVKHAKVDLFRNLSESCELEPLGPSFLTITPITVRVAGIAPTGCHVGISEALLPKY